MLLLGTFMNVYGKLVQVDIFSSDSILVCVEFVKEILDLGKKFLL